MVEDERWTMHKARHRLREEHQSCLDLAGIFQEAIRKASQHCVGAILFGVGPAVVPHVSTLTAEMGGGRMVSRHRKAQHMYRNSNDGPVAEQIFQESL